MWKFLQITIVTNLILSFSVGLSGAMEIIYKQFTPMVVQADEIVPVIFEAKIEGSPTAVRLQLQSQSQEIPLLDDGSSPDKTADDGVYTTTLSVSSLVTNFTPDDVNRNFVGYLRLYEGNAVQGQSNIFVDILTPNIPPVRIKRLTSDIQFTEHLVNIVDEELFTDGVEQIPFITQKFYSHFDDDYDYINIIYAIAQSENRDHRTIANKVQGIGELYEDPAYYGSKGRLMGRTRFPIPTMFDGASRAYQHELGHQWVNHLEIAPLGNEGSHWPLSDLASGIMGLTISNSLAGGNFDFVLRPVGSDYELVPDRNPKVFKDLSLYLMGLIPANEVGDHFVFNDQDQVPENGGIFSGPVTHVSVQDIIKQLGPRIPDYSQSPKKFRIATIIVSRDGLLSERAMRLYDYFSARAEAKTPLMTTDGFGKETSNPFYLSTRKLGELDTHITGSSDTDAPHPPTNIRIVN